VVVQEGTLVWDCYVCVAIAVDPREERLEDIIADEKVADQKNGKDEAGKGRVFRDRLDGERVDVRHDCS